MLWASLVASIFPRQDALDVFKLIASLGFKYRDKIVGPNEWDKWDLGHSSLINLPNDIFNEVIKLIQIHPFGNNALRPLLMFDSLPGKERWITHLKMEPLEGDWDIIASAIAKTLDHQSQESTDIRWLTLMFNMALGRIHFSPEMAEMTNCIVEYPNKGDMRSVRPSIRAKEMMLRPTDNALSPNWSESFWLECFEKTACVPIKISEPTPSKINKRKIYDAILEAQVTLYEHFYCTVSTTATDARHDTVFGFGFYALAVLTELLCGLNSRGIVGRLLLRCMVESKITLAYLLYKDDPGLWSKYRSFGTEQAKLALLKLEESESVPSFINESLLSQLANEDYFQEFISINLGHWCNLDLRTLAEDSNTKDDYDKFYGWASTFTHSHWSAIRGTCFTTCQNPLHRLHRFPLPQGVKVLDDSVEDGIYLVNAILSKIWQAYPSKDGLIVPVL
jgi:hypothetical protein